MTDRVKGFIVALDRDYRTDDVEAIQKAIEQIRGVQSVTPSIANSEDWMNRERVRREIRQRLWDALG